MERPEQADWLYDNAIILDPGEVVAKWQWDGCAESCPEKGTSACEDCLQAGVEARLVEVKP